MGRTAVPIVAANMTIVKGPFGVYARSKHNTVVSPRLATRNSCIRAQLKGKTHADLQSVWDAFRQASNACRGGGAPAAAGRRMSRFRR